MRGQKNKGTDGLSVVAAPVNPPQTDKPKKPRLRELPGFIPIAETARIAAVLNREPLLNLMAQLIFLQDNANLINGQPTTLPISESA